MARRNSSLLGDIINDLTHCPWWLSVGIAAGVYILLNNVLPSMKFEGLLFLSIAKAGPQLAKLFGMLFLMPAFVSLFHSMRKGNILKKQDGLASIKSLKWKEFEELVAEAYRKKGYRVLENDTLGPDGGVDLVLRKGGNQYLVQCKRWRFAKVTVNVVREMFGLMHAQGANGAIIVTTGLFTQEARNFAEGKSIDLVEGFELVKLVKSAQNIQSSSPSGSLTVILKKFLKNGFISTFKGLIIAVIICLISIFSILYWRPALPPEMANSNFIQNLSELFPYQEKTKPPVFEQLEPTTRAKDYVFSEKEISVVKEKLMKERQENTLFEIQLNTGRSIFAKNAILKGDVLSFENDTGLVVSMNKDDVSEVRKVIQR